MTRDRNNPGNIGLNDALGNYSLTLIDSLSTLAILAGGPHDEPYTGPEALHDFQDGVAQFVRHYGDGRSGPSGQGCRARGFDLDSKVQVFETVIRGVGGLLSAHLFAIGELPIAGYDASPDSESIPQDLLEVSPITWPGGFAYDGQLLRLAMDLAERLLPAFFTKTGIPYPRVNLRQGIPFYLNSPLHQYSEDDSPEEGEEEEVDNPEITETCSAGAGSLVLEFTVLSRLSGDPRFEHAAKRAFWEVWHRRSEIGLIGNGIDAERGVWIGPHAGIGAGMDSFFEYAVKSYILLSGQALPNLTSSQRQSSTDWLDPNSLHPPLAPQMHTSEAFLEAWHLAHASVKQYLYTDRNHYPYYSNSHRATGQPYTMWIDSLGAFYPGLLALAGEVEEAIEANLVYTALWTRYSAIPERWSIRESNVESGIGWWPGRPEFIESTYYIYRATGDPWYLHVGEMVLKDIKRRCRAPCGWAGLQDVRTGEKQDRMESFFLGETTKYMYLLFDPDHSLNKLDAAFVFTTEGHPLIIPKKRSKASASGLSKPKPQVSSYDDFGGNYTNVCPVALTPQGFTASATAARPNLFQASRFTDLYKTPNMHGPVDVVEQEDQTPGGVTRYKPTTNHTVFPWTLPTTMLPNNGTCTAPPERIHSWIEFPASDAASSLVARLGNSLVWHDHTGPTVKKLEGLKLQLERQRRENSDDLVWRITHVGTTQLGRHETVFFYAENVKHLNDEAFTCVRRQDAVEIEVLMPAQDDANFSTPFAADSTKMPSRPGTMANTAGGQSESLLQSLLKAVSFVFEPSITGIPFIQNNENESTMFSWDANVSVGPGAFPIPSIPDTPTVGNPFYSSKNPVSNFPWRNVYLGGYACDSVLPDSVPRTHQVIILLRGHCSFSKKIANIPAFFATRGALQLVIIVDEQAQQEGESDFVRPLLDDEQFTPNGMKRLHGVAMVLMKAGKGDYDLLGKAAGVGLRRKYWVESQGLKVENAVVM